MNDLTGMSEQASEAIVEIVMDFEERERKGLKGPSGHVYGELASFLRERAGMPPRSGSAKLVLIQGGKGRAS